MKSALLKLMLLSMALSPARTGVADTCFEKMPFGCFVIKSDIIPKGQTAAIGKKLGAPLEKLSNTYLRVHGTPIQINILEAETSAGAKQLHKTISAMKSNPAFCLIQGKKVIEFCKSVILRKQSNQSTSYAFDPKPTEIRGQSDGLISYFFKETPAMLNVPYVTLRAKIACDGTGLTPTDRKADKLLLSATPYWPVDAPQIQALAKRITAGKQTQEAKVQAILEWLTPGRNIKSDGPTGSRWGVKEVLEQKYGHCWDSSDCFVTLARASGIPSRQVGGWLYGTSGHIWAEVLVPGKGWRQVDPTGGGRLNCGIYHIPYFTTETGEMPILYLSMPQIEIVETQ